MSCHWTLDKKIIDGQRRRFDERSYLIISRLHPPIESVGCTRMFNRRRAFHPTLHVSSLSFGVFQDGIISHTSGEHAGRVRRLPTKSLLELASIDLFQASVGSAPQRSFVASLTSLISCELRAPIPSIVVLLSLRLIRCCAASCWCCGHLLLGSAPFPATSVIRLSSLGFAALNWCTPVDAVYRPRA